MKFCFHRPWYTLWGNATTHPRSHPHPQILNRNGIEDGYFPLFLSIFERWSIIRPSLNPFIFRRKFYFLVIQSKSANPQHLPLVSHTDSSEQWISKQILTVQPSLWSTVWAQTSTSVISCTRLICVRSSSLSLFILSPEQWCFWTSTSRIYISVVTHRRDMKLWKKTLVYVYMPGC